jgi:hypothetical protein
MILYMVCLWLGLKRVKAVANANACRYNASNRADCEDLIVCYFMHGLFINARYLDFSVVGRSVILVNSSPTSNLKPSLNNLMTDSVA